MVLLIKRLKGVIFSLKKSKIWGATTTPHIVPSAKLKKKAL